MSMSMNPIVSRFRQFNAAALGVAVLLLLLACRKLSLQLSVVAVIVAVVAGLVAIITWHHLRTRRGIVLIGCTRRTFDSLTKALLQDKPLGATYRPGRRIGPIRELSGHWRDKSIDDNALISAVKQYFVTHPQQLTPRDAMLLLAWGCGSVIAILVMAWLLLR